MWGYWSFRSLFHLRRGRHKILKTNKQINFCRCSFLQSFLHLLKLVYTGRGCEMALTIQIYWDLVGTNWSLCIQLLCSGFHFKHNKSLSPGSHLPFSLHKSLCQVLCSSCWVMPHQYWTRSARGGTRPTSVKGQIDHSADGTTEGYTTNYMHECGVFITVKCSQNS